MRQITEVERREIEGLLAKDEDVLLLDIGSLEALDSGELYSATEARRKGELLFSRTRDVGRELICEEWQYCDKKSRGRLGHDVTLVAAIADLLLASLGTIPATQIAALLVKRGLDRLCECGDGS